MSFEAHTGFLKADFVMSSVLALLGVIVLGTLASNSYKEYALDSQQTKTIYSLCPC